MKARVRSALVDATPDDRNFHRALIQSRIWDAADHHKDRPDHEQIIWLLSAAGEVAHAWESGHSDLAYEVESLMGGLAAWREQMAERARCATKTDTQREANAA